MDDIHGYELHCGNPSIGLMRLRDGAQVLKAPPGLTTAPSTQPALQLQPVLRRWLIAARTVAAVHI